MPLDTGTVEPLRTGATVKGGGALPWTQDLDAGVGFGEALKRARERAGLSIDDIAEATRVRSSYIVALEAFQLDGLPSRPFAVGYVRAYAQALGLDGDRAVSRFKEEAPPVDEALRNPIGVKHETTRRFGALAGVGVALVAAIVVWNFARHAMAEQPRRPAGAPVAAAAPPSAMPAAGPATLGAPLPAPPEATIPPPYRTPGIPDPNAPVGADGSKPAAPVAVDSAAAPTLGAPFVANGAIYGDAGGASGVILQARKPTTLVVRGGDGAVYFARQLSAGEAWRAPQLKGLVAEVGNPSSAEVFVGGVSRGLLTDPQTSLSKYGG